MEDWRALRKAGWNSERFSERLGERLSGRITGWADD